MVQGDRISRNKILTCLFRVSASQICKPNENAQIARILHCDLYIMENRDSRELPKAEALDWLLIAEVKCP